MNKFCVSVAPGATTIDAQKGFWHETPANAAATTITDITGAKDGVAYIIECGEHHQRLQDHKIRKLLRDLRRLDADRCW
jgi:hypothetical protein